MIKRTGIFAQSIQNVYFCRRGQNASTSANMNISNGDIKNFDYESFFEDRLSKGIYTFSTDDLSSLEIQASAYRRALSRYVCKGTIYPVRKGFYIIIPVEYKTKGIVPESLFIADLMSHLRRPYYVGLLSAAALHGAAHQQPMSFYVIQGGAPLREISTEKHKIDFISKHSWSSLCTMTIKTKAGYMNVSTPEATMLDLIEYQRTLGIGRVTEVLLELSERIDRIRFRKTLPLYAVALRQRLGYIFDLLSLDSSLIEKSLSREKLHIVPFSLIQSRKGNVNLKWKIIENETINIDIL